MKLIHFFENIAGVINKKILRRDGILFRCKRCGGCCKREGSVYYTREELEKAARNLGIATRTFKHRYITNTISGIYESYTSKACPLFTEEKGCLIYKDRPIQCSTFPFWRSYFTSKEEMDKLYKECPGTHSGKFYSAKEIKKRLKREPLFF